MKRGVLRSGAVLGAICGAAITPTACTIIKDDKNEDSAGSTASAGSARTAGRGEEAANPQAGPRKRRRGRRGGRRRRRRWRRRSAGGDGRSPAPIVDGDVRVSCTAPAKRTRIAQKVPCSSARAPRTTPVRVTELRPSTVAAQAIRTSSPPIRRAGDVIEQSTVPRRPTAAAAACGLAICHRYDLEHGQRDQGVVASIDSFAAVWPKKASNADRWHRVRQARTPHQLHRHGRPLRAIHRQVRRQTRRPDSSSFNYGLIGRPAIAAMAAGDGLGRRHRRARVRIGVPGPAQSSKSEPILFKWSRKAVRCRDYGHRAQRQSSDGTTVAHYDLAQLAKDVRGFALGARGSGPNLGCR